MNNILEYAKYCEVAYMSPTSINDPELFRVQHDIDEYRVITSDIGTCWVLIKSETIIFAFPGTDSLHDMYLDTQFKLTPLDKAQPKLGLVHSGFKQYALSMKADIYTAIEDFLMSRMSADELVYYTEDRSSRKTHQSVEFVTDIKLNKKSMLQVHRINPPRSHALKNIVFTGHSLGGCCAIMAMLTARDFRKIVRIKCYTYGSPMLGDKRFAKSLFHYVPYTFNVIHRNDIVPKTPCFLKYHEQHGIMIIDDDSRVLLGPHLWYMFVVLLCSCLCVCHHGIRYTSNAIRGEAHKLTNYIHVLEKIYADRTEQSRREKAEYIARIYPIFSASTSPTPLDDGQKRAASCEQPISVTMSTSTSLSVFPIPM